MSRFQFYYAYAHDKSDAVARALDQMAVALTNSGNPSQVLSTRPVSRNRGVQQLAYGIRAALHMMKADSSTAIITVDVPTGIGLVGAAIARLRRAQHVALVMDLYQFQPDRRSTFTQRLRRQVDALSLRWAGRVVAIGSCMAELIETTTGRDSAVVPIWVPAQHDAAVPLPRSSIGIEHGRLVLLYSGHAGEQHPLSAVVEAVCDDSIRDRVALVIAGWGVARDAARAVATERALSNVHFLEPLPPGQVPSLLALGDVHLVSLAEQATGTCVPSKAYTAMSAGRPVLYVGSPNGQAAIDVNHVGGSVASTVTDIVEAIRAFEESAELRLRVGAAGRRFSQEARSPESQAARLMDEIKLPAVRRR